MNLRDCVMVIYADNVIIDLLLNFILLFSNMLVNMLGMLAWHTSFLDALSVTLDFETLALRISVADLKYGS